MENDVYIIAAKRTPIGKYGGNFLSLSAIDLAVVVVKKLLEENPKVQRSIDEVIMGNVLSAGLGQNPARIVAYKSGIPQTVPAFTVNKVCGSSLKSIILATQAILNGDGDVFITGGMENMSRVPFLLDNYRFGVKAGNQITRDTMIYDGLFCSLIGEHMGMTAEHIAQRYRISREKQDVYAFLSHQKALLAIRQKKFQDEIVPVFEADTIATDEQPRTDASITALRKLQTPFKPNGTVTAGNASPLNDAAAAMIIVSGQFVKRHKIKPLAKLVSFASVGVDPKVMGLGAYYAAKKCLAKAKLSVKDIHLWEINESFASQMIAVLDFLQVDPKKVNINGGAIALGHPIGASGARILTTLIYALKKQSKQYGMASLCIGGGQGIAALVEMV
jgi:acetyl-CoA C-acetyltransferase